MYKFCRNLRVTAACAGSKAEITDECRSPLFREVVSPVKLALKSLDRTNVDFTVFQTKYNLLQIVLTVVVV